MTAPVPTAALYRQMLRMRRFEEHLGDLWERGLISGELHLGIGEEGIVAGVVEHLVEGDALALDHRPTPVLVGRGTDLGLMALEMVGSEDGLCRGRGGHMHLFDPDRLAASSGIVGASGPLACGFALSAQHLRPERIAVAFCGESALNQGMMMEAMNLAVVWKLPVLFVVKDNGWAVTTRSKTMTGGSVRRRAAGFGLRYRAVDGIDAGRVWAVAGDVIGDLRRGRGPAMLHATCHRPRGHFEHDPLIRMVTDSAELRREVGPLARAFVRPAGRVRDRIAAMGRIAATAVRMRAHLTARRDPLSRLERRMTAETVARIRASVEAEVASELEGVGDP